MPPSAKPPVTRAVVLRGIGFTAAIMCGAIAAWLVVTGEDQQTLRIGMLVGLWGLVLGAYSMFGARRGAEAAADPAFSREVVLREGRELERQDEAAARRDWESRLERLINREISTAVGRETAALRSEIAHLRQELLDQVGGQLRLERIETTRVIGSDLEALQHEVRQLKDANGRPSGAAVRELLAVSNDPRIAVRPVVEPARVRPVSRPTAEVEADVRPAVGESTGWVQRVELPRPPEPTRVPAATPPAASTPPAPSAPRVTPPSRPSVADDPAARVHRAPPASASPPAPMQPPRPATPEPTTGTTDGARSQADGADPFAGLPRLTRFTDYPPPSAANGNGNGNGNGHAPANGNGQHPADDPTYTGRRRRADEAPDASEPAEAPGFNGRHTGQRGPAARPETPAAGRRRRHDDHDEQDDDLLARLLSRESH